MGDGAQGCLTPISCPEAKALGLKRYFTGRPCKAGHTCERLVSNGTCLECQMVSYRKAKAADPERFRQYGLANGRRFRERHPEKDREYAERHRDAMNARSREWAAKNREKVRASKKKWKRGNADWARGWSQRRREQLRCATPSWLTPQQIAEIDAFYIKAAAMGPEWHVDHIVPINGKTICGLHVPWNLQIISAAENHRKSNRLIEELALAA